MKAALSALAELVSLSWKLEKGRLSLGLGLMVLAGAARPLLAVTTAAGVDAIVDREVGRAALIGVLTGAAAIATLTISHFAFIPYAEVGERAAVEAEAELMRLATRSAGMRHEGPEFTDQVTVARRSLGERTDGLIGLMNAISLVISLVISGVLLARLDPVLLLLPLASLPSLLAGRASERILDAARERSAAAVRLSGHMLDLATTASTSAELRLYGAQDDVRGRQARFWNEAGEILMRAERRSAVLSSAGQLTSALAYVGAVLLVVRRVIAHDGDIGDVVLVVTLAAQLNQQLESAVQFLRTLQRVMTGVGRLRRIRDLTGPEREPATTETVPARLREGIQLRGVSFAYPGTDRPVLRDLDLFLPAGKLIAVVGDNGAGKSTLAALLSRMYEPSGGRIVVDGSDLAQLPPDAWLRRIAITFQDFVRFETTAGETVGLGDLPRRTDVPAIRAALARADATSVVDALPAGLATQLGVSWSGGTELSGGQWQRLAISRGMMRSAPLLVVLDEPASALDAFAEHEIFERYATRAARSATAAGTITLLMSHRFSTVTMADLVIVLSDGKVAEFGAPAALMAAGGRFAAMYSLHASAYDTSPAHEATTSRGAA